MEWLPLLSFEILFNEQSFQICPCISLFIQETMIGDSDKTCPLCTKDYSELMTGQKLKPCQCGYQVKQKNFTLV